jgi:hypothetical protein
MPFILVPRLPEAITMTIFGKFAVLLTFLSLALANKPQLSVRLNDE